MSRRVTPRMRAVGGLLALALVICACASPLPPAPPVHAASVVSGTIGIAVTAAGAAVVVAGVGSQAARAGVHVGDQVLRYNGAEIRTARQFERLVLDSAPGSTVRLEFSRAGATLAVDLLVEQIRTGNRA